MTEESAQRDPGALELLSFHVGRQDYSVDIMSVREIRGWSKATQLPHAPAYVRGVINLRGSVLPIIDLAARLGLTQDPETARSVIIVVCIEGQSVGLLVSAVSDILSIRTEELQPPPELAADANRSFIRALTVVEDRMIRVLDLCAVLPRSGDLAA